MRHINFDLIDYPGAKGIHITGGETLDNDKGSDLIIVEDFKGEIRIESVRSKKLTGKGQEIPVEAKFSAQPEKLLGVTTNRGGSRWNEHDVCTEVKFFK